MKKTKKMNVVLAMVLSMTLLFGATISVNAASSTVTFTVEQSDITTAVTVPGQLPIIFNADGTNTYPTNWKVYNNSELGAVRLKLVELNQRNDWELVKEDVDIKANTHDSKEIKFYMGVPNKLRIFAPYSGGGSKMSFEEGYEVVIPAGGSQQFDFKIGFDSCTVPALINMTSNINEDSFDTCEGGRWSAYITSDMKMLPCSFDNQDMRWAYDISNDTVQNAWNSKQFEDFRDHFRNSCRGCSRQCECRGGCPIRRQIVLCNREEKDLYESTRRFCD